MNNSIRLSHHLFISPEKRQTMLFSATQTRNVEDLARISLKKAPLYVGVDDHKATSTVEGLEQVCRWKIFITAASVLTHIFECVVFKDVYLRNAMHNLNKIWVVALIQYVPKNYVRVMSFMNLTADA